MTDHDVMEPSVDERSASAERDHPPLRLRERRLVLLPDLRPPSVDEIRWAVRQRRVRRTSPEAAPAPEQRRPVRHDPPPPREPADVVATIEEPAVEEATAVEPQAPEIVLPDIIASEPTTAEAVIEPDGDDDFFDLYDPEFPDLRPWRPLESPEAEAPEDGPAALIYPIEPDEPEAFVEPDIDTPSDDEEPPLVSHVLVVREPVRVDPGRIAVLDEVEADAPTITRLVPLPPEPADEIAFESIGSLAVEAPEYSDVYVEELEELEPDLEADAEVSGRAAPLYWRLLRLHHTRPNGWLRALYFEGAVALGVVLVLAEAASVWTIVVLPLIVAVVVKANDVLAGNLRRAYREPKRRSGS